MCIVQKHRHITVQYIENEMKKNSKSFMSHMSQSFRILMMMNTA